MSACGPECNGTWPGPRDQPRRPFHVKGCPNDPQPPAVAVGPSATGANPLIGGVPDHHVEHLCIVMHDAYEAEAARVGWNTQAASRKPWAEVPEANKAAMRAAVRAMLAALFRPAGAPWPFAPPADDTRSTAQQRTDR